jgi:integral membrane protein (TIGR01906 family)
VKTTATPTVRLVGVARLLAGVAIAIAIPTFLVTDAVRSVTLNESLYVAEFARYHVGAVTGLSDAELRRVAGAFITYFQSDPQELRISVDTGSGLTPLFNDREVRHMEDVQQLIEKIFQLRIAALILFVLGAVAMMLTGPRAAARAFFRSTAIGGATSALLIGALAVAAAFDFDRLFLQFHFMSFSNDLWLLDPRRDRLIQLFPEGFFFDFAMRIGIQTVGVGLATLVASLGMLFTLGRRQTTQ